LAVRARASKLFWPAQSGLALEQEREPFGMVEGASVGMIDQFTEALGHAVEAEFVQ
jgi:hypothetical protein